MMFCPKCGKNLPNQTLFCDSCGARLESIPNSQIKMPKKQLVRKKGMKLRIALLVMSIILLLISAVGGVLLYQYYTSPEQVILRSLSSGNYTEAVRLYERNYDEEDTVPEDIVRTASKVLDDLYISFVNEDASYNATCNNIESISKLNISELEDKLSTTKDAVDALNDSRIAFEAGNQYMTSQKYKEAILEYKKVISDDQNYETAEEKLQSAEDSYRVSILDAAKKKADDGNISAAITTLESGLNVLENDSDLTQKLKQYQSQQEETEKKDALESAKSEADSGDYASALHTIEKALQSYPDDADLKTQYATYQDAYVKNVIAKADADLANNDYASAISKLQIAADALPDNTALSDKLAKTISEKPTELCELKFQNKENFGFTDNAVEDVQGNLYSGNDVLMFYGDRYISSNGFIEFYCDGDYRALSFTLVPETNFSSTSAITIEILTDDASKKAIKVTQKMEATQVDVDITGCQWLQIKASPIEGISSEYTTVILANPVVKK